MFPSRVLRRLGPLSLALGEMVVGSAAWPSESRAATITVTGSGDTVAVDGLVTLREAIASINGGANVNADVVAVGAYGSSDTIAFAIPGLGVHTIQPTSAFLVTKPVLINGYSQPGASKNTLPVGNNAVLLIEIDGTNAGGLSGGLIDIGGGGSTVTGLVINRAQGISGNGAGIRLVTNGGSTVTGSFIGTDPTGAIARAIFCNGLQIEASSPGNTIGGTDPGDRNVITNANICGSNIDIASPNNQVLNNYLGTNAAGNAAIHGNVGVVIGGAEASGNVIGGTTAAARNVISGNSTFGVSIGASGNIVQGNFIGTDASGTSSLPNGIGGVLLYANASNNTIGGTAAGAGNRIAFNSGIGVALSAPPNAAGTGNAILGNSIFSNAGLGIDINEDGVTANDHCDADIGPNNLQNFPVLTAVTAGAGSTTIQGTLDSAANTAYRIEFFANDVCDPSGFGEGQTFLGSTMVTTDAFCNGAFSVTLPVSVAPTALLTATVTDPAGNTSEFSACFPAQTTFFTVSPCRVADTRNAPGPSGGPALAANTVRSFPVTGVCSIPSSARAVAIILAVFLPSDGGDLRVYPAGGTAPLASSINFRPAIVRANNAVVPLGTGGQISAQCDMPIGSTGSTNFFFDVYGYFQ